MCGKKLTSRDGGPDQRRQYIDTSLFYWEYLNNSLNYILSGANDLDHAIQFDNTALRQIIATDPGQESIHFVQRTRLMKTRCDPANYLKDIQQYGEFINSNLSRATHQEIKNIEEELEEEFNLGILIKRLRKRYRKLDERLTLYQVEQLQKQMKRNILKGLLDDQENVEIEEDKHLDENRLYRELFNIQEHQVKEEKIEHKKSERFRGAKAGSKRKVADDFALSSSKNKNTLPALDKPITVVPQKMVEEKVKKEENIDKNPIRHFPAALPVPVPFFIETIQPTLAPVPVARSQPSNIIPFVPPRASVGRPPLSSHPPTLTSPAVTSIPTFKHAFIIEKIDPIVIQPSHPLIIQKIFPRDNEANPSSNVTPSAEPLSKATDSDKKVKKEKKIDKDKKKSKAKPKEERQKEKEQDKEKDETKREKRPYNRKQTNPAKSEGIKFPVAELQTIIPITTFDRRPVTSSVQIGIQSDWLNESQNLKVITPRLNSTTFTVPAIETGPQKPAQQERLPEVRREMVPEPRSEPVDNQRNLLGNSLQFGQRSSNLPMLSALGLLVSQRMDIEVRIDPSPSHQLSHPQQPHSNDPQRKKDEFNIDDYLI